MRPEISVAIPAKNEEHKLLRSLAALHRQRDLQGRPLDLRRFEVVILANNCNDGTAEIARAFARSHPDLHISVHEAWYALEHAHIGTARNDALNIACRRQETLSACGIIASTDADSCVDPFWIAQTLHEMRNADAVAGCVRIERSEEETFPAALRRLYALECAYRNLRGAVSAMIDPLSYDPPARHDSFVGASFAVRADVYRKAGGLPIVPVLEDLAFSEALLHMDARIRHSYAVRVHTSARTESRASGGFGSLLQLLGQSSGNAREYLVDHARSYVQRAIITHALRRRWQTLPDSPALARIADAYSVCLTRLNSCIDRSISFGHAVAKAHSIAAADSPAAEQPVEEAIAELRKALTFAMPASAMRSLTASGAG